MPEFIKTYAGMLIGVGVVVGVGILVTQGFLDSKFADVALGFIIGGGIGFAGGAKVTPKE